MSFRFLRRAPAVISLAAALLLGGCTPLDEIFRTTLRNPNSPPPAGTPDPDPVPDPVPDPDPDPQPGPSEVAVVVSTSNLVVAEGASARLEMRLSAQPAGDRSVSAAFSQAGGGLRINGASSFTFTSADWDVPKSLEIAAPEDSDATDGVGILQLTLDGVLPVVLSVVAADNDVPAGDGVRLTVKDSSGEGAVDMPVTAVLPLEYGKFQTTDRFRITDASGLPVAAQFEVVNRWWARDNSLRHVAAHFHATVAAQGQSYYFFKTDNGTKGTPAKAVSVTDASGAITVDTGAIRFKVSKGAFNLFDEVFLDQNGDGSYASSERVVASGASEGEVFTGRLAGDVQRARDRSDLRFTVEETGPMRAVVRVSGLTIFQGTENHKHGFAVRLYAYAGKPWVRVEYQLQNSAKNVKFSWPLYFEDVSLVVKPDLSSPTVRHSIRPGESWSGTGASYLFQSSLTDGHVRRADGSTLKSASTAAGNSAFAWTDVSDASRGVAVMIRHMAEMWPNGVEVGADNAMSVRLWPKWSAQFAGGSSVSSTGLYWLDDMQHVVKETLFWFHGANLPASDLDRMSANFHYQPIAVVPVSEYRRTGVTVDCEGLFPKDAGLGGTDTRRVGYNAYQLDPTGGWYNFGWRDFGGDTGRKASATTGNWPDSSANVFASGRVDHFFAGERRMWGDLNCRPMWLAEYDHDTDFDLIRPTVNPYAGDSWRAFDGHGLPTLAAPYLPGTAWSQWTPRDNEHGWLYHIEEYYYASYNLWVRDWYKWIGEFRKRTLFRTETGDDAIGPGTDPYFEWEWQTRGEGHMLGNSLQAFRVTGDAQLLAGIRNRLDWLHSKRISPQFGILYPNGEAVFGSGFLARALENCFSELRYGDPEYSMKAFNLFWGIVDWNFNTGRWQHFTSSYADNSGAGSKATGMTMIDPASVFYLLTGRRNVLNDATQYVNTGVNGGERPYGSFPIWGGGWEGRAYESVMLALKANETPPPAITDLAVSVVSGKARLQWTAPSTATRYHVVWSRLPISRTYTKDADKRNPWACEVVGNTLVAAPGTRQSIDVGGLPAGTKVYFAILSFNSNENMSDPSNVASVDMP